jgi:hypothetical protein
VVLKYLDMQLERNQQLPVRSASHSLVTRRDLMYSSGCINYVLTLFQEITGIGILRFALDAK